MIDFVLILLACFLIVYAYSFLCAVKLWKYWNEMGLGCLKRLFVVLIKLTEWFESQLREYILC